MKLIALFITLFSLHAQASRVQEYIQIHADGLTDKNLVKIESLAKDLISQHKLSLNPNSCGDVITFRGPRDPLSARNLSIWITGIANEMATIYQDEDLKLTPVKLNLKDIQQKVTLLADRNMLVFDAKGVESLSQALFAETQLDPKSYYFLFGDYLDGKMGWVTAVTLVKLSSGEAVMIANANDCL